MSVSLHLGSGQHYYAPKLNGGTHKVHPRHNRLLALSPVSVRGKGKQSGHANVVLKDGTEYPEKAKLNPMATLSNIIFCANKGLEGWTVDENVSEQEIPGIVECLVNGHVRAMHNWDKVPAKRKFGRTENLFQLYYQLGKFPSISHKGKVYELLVSSECNPSPN